MTRRPHHEMQCVIALLLLFAITAGQTAALTGAHERHRTQDHGCLVCYAGSLLFLQSSTGVPLDPVLGFAWLESTPDFDAQFDDCPAASSSRAPPA
jgi:hypothetical protein